MDIPVVLVDDDELDRYITARQLAKVDEFGPVIEVESGDELLKSYFQNDSIYQRSEMPVLILMDINMPGSSGFDTIEEIQEALGLPRPSSVPTFVMFSSSGSELDKDRANNLDLVKGFLSKPLTAEGAMYLRDIYTQNMQ